MQFNFESVMEELAEKFSKKLGANDKAIVKQITSLFDFLGDRLPYEQRKQLQQIVGDIVISGSNSHFALFQETLNKIVRQIREVVHD